MYRITALQKKTLLASIRYSLPVVFPCSMRKPNIYIDTSPCNASNPFYLHGYSKNIQVDFSVRYYNNTLKCRRVTGIVIKPKAVIYSTSVVMVFKQVRSNPNTEFCPGSSPQSDITAVFIIFFEVVPLRVWCIGDLIHKAGQ